MPIVPGILFLAVLILFSRGSTPRGDLFFYGAVLLFVDATFSAFLLDFVLPRMRAVADMEWETFRSKLSVRIKATRSELALELVFLVLMLVGGILTLLTPPLVTREIGFITTTLAAAGSFVATGGIRDRMAAHWGFQRSQRVPRWILGVLIAIPGLVLVLAQFLVS